MKLLFFLIPKGNSQNINDITYFDEKTNLIGQSPKIKQNSIIKEDKYFQNMANKAEHQKNSISNASTHHDEILTSNNKLNSNKLSKNDKERLLLRNETILWFNSLNTGFNLQNDHEIEKLIVIRQKLLQVEYNCPGYINKAVRFAKIN